jgi:hypothetical protein
MFAAENILWGDAEVVAKLDIKGAGTSAYANDEAAHTCGPMRSAAAPLRFGTLMARPWTGPTRRPTCATLSSAA